MKKKAKKYKSPGTTVKKKEVRASSLPGKQSNLPLILILLFTFVAYIPALKAGFVNWDDPDYVSSNPIIKNIAGMGMIFTNPIQGNYHPLTVISLILNYYI